MTNLGGALALGRERVHALQQVAVERRLLTTAVELERHVLQADETRRALVRVLEHTVARLTLAEWRHVWK